MTDLREIRHFIGIKIDRTNGEICLSQSAYIKNVLKKFNMEECNSVSTPLPNKLDYTALQSEISCYVPCRKLIMLFTAPDLSTSISILCRYTNNNNKELWQCLKRVLRYLKRTVNIKLRLKKEANFFIFLFIYILALQVHTYNYRA